MRRHRKHRQANCDSARGFAGFALATLIYLAGRRSGSGKAKETEAPKPCPSQETRPEKFARCLTRPVRKKDRDKKRLEEEEAHPPEPAKDTCSKKILGCVTLICGGAADPKAAGAKEESKEKPEEMAPLTSVVLKVLGVIATGISVTGAVVVVGAAIFWARFDAIGIPPTQAIAAIPRTELLVLGAQETIIFVLIGLGATLLIALTDPQGTITRGSLAVLVLLVVGATAFAIWGTTLSWGWVLGLGVLASSLAVIATVIGFTTKQRLLPLLISVFIASIAFSAACAFLIVENQRFAQAIAIHFGPKAKKRGLVGIYVTVTEKTIFFGRSGRDPALNGAVDTGLYEVPRSDTTTYAVGPLELIEDDDENIVEETGEKLLRRLEKDSKSASAVGKSKGKKSKPPKKRGSSGK